MDRPLLVGWSYGAALAVHWIPYGLTGEAGRERIRRLFRRMRWLFLLASRLGLAARMTADQHAEINIEINEICAAIGPVLGRGTYPVRYILATGGNLGGGEEEMEQMRASFDPVLARNPSLRVSAKVASNHSHIVRKDFRAIAEAVIGDLLDADPGVVRRSLADVERRLTDRIEELIERRKTLRRFEARPDSATRYGLINHHRADQWPTSARLTQLIEPKCEGFSGSAPHDQPYVARAVTGDRSISAAEGSTSEPLGRGSTPTPSEENVLYLRVRYRSIQPVPGEPRSAVWWHSNAESVAQPGAV